MRTEEEYLNLFYSESIENVVELNSLISALEKDRNNTKALQSIFRLVHTIKGNAMSVGVDDIAIFSHSLEDVLGAITSGQLIINDDIQAILFRSVDKLNDLVNAKNEKIGYKGLKARLDIVFQKRNKDSVPISNDFQEENDNEDEDRFSDSGVVRLPIDKIDRILDEVNELVIQQDRIISISRNYPELSDEVQKAKRIISELQYQILKARTIPVNFIFNKFQRMVRDLAEKENKQIELVLDQKETELDRSILKILGDSLGHIIRNAISHGIELPSDREVQNKEVKGKIELDANYSKEKAIITVKDDGRGIDPKSIKKKLLEQKLLSEEKVNQLSDKDLISQVFLTGFSSAKSISDVSGRGVGMGSVKQNIESIGGQVMINSTVGKGTEIKLIMPSSLSVIEVLLYKNESNIYGINLLSIKAVISVQTTELKKMSDGYLVEYDHEYLPAISFNKITDAQDLTKVDTSSTNEINDKEINVIVISHSNRKIALIIDEVLNQHQAILKNLPSPVENHPLYSGTTILGNGELCLILDISSLTSLVYNQRLQ